MAEIVELARLLLVTVGPARDYIHHWLLNLVADSGYTVEELFPTESMGAKGERVGLVWGQGRGCFL